MTWSEDMPLEGLDALLMRVLDGEADESERRELLALADADLRLAELEELRAQLRAAVLEQAGDTIDVVGKVLDALAISDGWDALSHALRENLEEEVAGAGLADSVMASIRDLEADSPVEEAPAPAELELSCLYDGELSIEERLRVAARLGEDPAALARLNSYGTLSLQVKDAVTAHSRGADLSGVWSGVAVSIGIDPEAVEGWEPVAAAIVQAVEDQGQLSDFAANEMLEAIMMETEEARTLPLEGQFEPGPLESGRERRRLFVPALVLAAAVVLLINPISEQVENAQDNEEGLYLDYAALNQAEVIELEYDSTVFVQVLQDEDEEAPLILYVDEDAFDEDFEDTQVPEELEEAGEQVDTGEGVPL